MRLRFDTCLFDSDVRELTRGGKRVPLTPKAYALLEALIQIRPQPISRESLSELLWPETAVETDNLHNLVAEIRKAIGDDDHAVIRTVHRFGYAFDATGAIEESARFMVIVGREEIPLRDGETVIGRDPSDDIVISALEVSRHHARLVVDGDSVTLEDLGSKNGTFLGTERVSSPRPISPGDTILIGTKQMRLERVQTLPSTRTAV